MFGPDPPSERLIGWHAALLRVAAFLALGFSLLVVLGALYAMLPVPDTGAAVLLGATVPAAAAVVAGIVLLRGLDGRSAAALGIGVSRATPALAGLGFGIGAAALACAVLGIAAAGALRYDAQAGGIGEWLLTLLGHAGALTVAAFAEEAIFRGYPFQALAAAFGAPVAVTVSSVAFAVAHGRNPEVDGLALFNIFLGGVLLSLAYIRTLSLWFATAVHAGWNWTVMSLFDLPVSGYTFDTPLYDARVAGPDWWTGGAFGPEGGLVGTLGFGIAMLAVLRLRAVRPDPGVTGAGPLMQGRVREAGGTR